MDQDSPEHGRKRLIVVRGPFDEDKTVQDVIKRRNEFLLRTGLHEYAQVIHRGAFLARRPFGEQQVRYLRDERKAEDERRRKEVEKLNGKANDTLEGSRVGRQDTDVGPTDTDDIIKLRRKYEDEQFESEGNRGRWQIYVRQNWHVHALVLCCSLGAVIQGMDESAVNGGVIYFEELRTRLTVEQHSYTIRRNSRLRGMLRSSACSTWHHI